MVRLPAPMAGPRERAVPGLMPISFAEATPDKTAGPISVSMLPTGSAERWLSTVEQKSSVRTYIESGRRVCHPIHSIWVLPEENLVLGSPSPIPNRIKNFSAPRANLPIQGEETRNLLRCNIRVIHHHSYDPEIGPVHVCDFVV